VVRRDVRFEEEKAFRKSYDVRATTGDRELLAPKEESSQVQVGRGTSVETSTQTMEQDEE
jgi:hypothetical protein